VVWTRLIDIYGHRFTSQHGQVGGDGFGTWCRDLNGLKKEDIDHGLHVLEGRVEKAYLHEENAYPPNSIEFRSICKPASVPAAHLPFMRAEPESEEAMHKRIEAGKSGIVKLKDLLTG